MNIEDSRSPEITSISFQETLRNLSDIKNPIPLTPEKINIIEIKNQLLRAGIRIDLIEQDPNLQESIKNAQFRGPKQGKGPAIMTVLGETNYRKFFNWATDESINQPLLSEGDESSKSRGLMQFLGETIALASGQMTKEDYCKKVNFRVGKKYKKDDDLVKKFNLPEDKELKKISSIPKGSAIKAYEIILSLNKNN